MDKYETQIEAVKGAGFDLYEARSIFGLDDGNSFFVMSKPAERGVIQALVGRLNKTTRVIVDNSDNSRGVHIVVGEKAYLNVMEAIEKAS